MTAASTVQPNVQLCSVVLISFLILLFIKLSIPKIQSALYQFKTFVSLNLIILLNCNNNNNNNRTHLQTFVAAGNCNFFLHPLILPFCAIITTTITTTICRLSSPQVIELCLLPNNNPNNNNNNSHHLLDCASLQSKRRRNLEKSDAFVICVAVQSTHYLIFSFLLRFRL